MLPHGRTDMAKAGFAIEARHKVQARYGMRPVVVRSSQAGAAVLLDEHGVLGGLHVVDCPNPEVGLCLNNGASDGLCRIDAD